MFLVVLGILSGSFGAILLKSGSAELKYDTSLVYIVFQAITSIKIVFAIILYMIPSITWIYLLKTLDITMLQPMLSLTYVLTALLAYVFFNEYISTMRWLGIGIIIIGVIFVSRS